MVYPDHNILYKLFFNFYTARIIKSDFHAFEIEHSNFQPSAEKPLLIIANHISWWDGFFHYHLNNLIFKKKFHVMMLEEQLVKRMFLTKLGIFGVKKGSRDAIKSLDFANQLLKSRENMLLLFPQGKIESQHKQEFAFERGVEKLFASNPGLQVVFTISLIDYFSLRKPVVRFYIKSVETAIQSTLEKDFNVFYKECLQKQFQLAS